MPTWYYADVSHITTVTILATIHLKYSCAPTKEAFQLGREKSFAALLLSRTKTLSAAASLGTPEGPTASNPPIYDLSC